MLSKQLNSSDFLRKELNAPVFKPCLQPIQKRKLRVKTSALPVLAEVSSTVQLAVDQVAVAAGPLRPVVATLGRDIASLIALAPTLPGIARLLGFYYVLLSRPNPMYNLIDFFVTGPILEQTQNKYDASKFILRGRLGGGNFGVTYEGLQLAEGEGKTMSMRVELTPEQKKRRVVLKRVNLDREGVRTDFLKAGTLAKGASESGRVEAYMNAKIKRNPLVAAVCATYLGYFVVDESDGGFTKGSQWLVWRFESDATLGDALDGALGPFPGCLEGMMLRRSGTADQEKRDSMIIRTMFRQILGGLSRLHSIGIVHRDVKPENLLITVDGEVKFIDLGASVDMCTGINFNPLSGMLDPRYSPPEELVMPQSFPRAPSPAIAAVLSPFAWVYGCPDLFDSYSAGVLFMRMSVPELRATANFRQFNNELRQYDYDLDRWREYRGGRYDFSLLDRNNGAGWDLAMKLLAKRDSFNRGRYSVDQALSHRFFRFEF